LHLLKGQHPPRRWALSQVDDTGVVLAPIAVRVVEPVPVLTEIAEPHGRALRHCYRDGARAVCALGEDVRSRGPVIEVTDDGHRADGFVLREYERDLEVVALGHLAAAN